MDQNFENHHTSGNLPLERVNRGLCWSRLGNHQEAVESYDKVISLRPNHAKAYLKKGICLADLGRDEEAIESYSKAIFFNPNDPTAYEDKGNLLCELGRYEEALDCSNKCLSLNPDNTTASSLKVDSLHGLERYKEAIEFLQEALESDPKHSLWHCDLARTFECAGNSKKALEHFKLAKIFLEECEDFLDENEICHVESFFERISELEAMMENSNTNSLDD